MALDKVLVSSGGVTRTIPFGDTADVGSGIQSDASASSLTINAAVGSVLVTSVANFNSSLQADGGIATLNTTTLNVGADANTQVANFGTGTAITATNIGKVGTLTTVNGNLQVQGTETVIGATTLDSSLTQSGGTFSLTGNAASQISTSAGSLTLTGAAASTWSTAAGALTLTSAAAATWGTAAGALTLNGFGGMNLQNNGTTNLTVGAGTLVIQSGTTLSATGTGQINLPQNFLINSVATAYANPGSGAGFGQVTAAALNTITAGPTSNADAYHTHNFSSAVAETAGAAIAAGQLVAFQNNAGVGNVYPATADGTTPALQNVVGVATTSAAAAGTTSVLYAGPATVPNTLFNGTAPVAADIGKRVYMDDTTGANAGKYNLVAPSASGDYTVHVGIVASISGSNIIVWVQIGEGVIQ